MVSEEPPTASGGITALTREPSSRRASTSGRGFIDAAAHLGHDALNDLAQVVLGAEPGFGERQLALAFHVDLVHPVHHDFGDGRIVQQPLQRAVPEHVVGHIPDQPGALVRGQRDLLRIDDADELFPGRAAELAAR